MLLSITLDSQGLFVFKFKVALVMCHKSKFALTHCVRHFVASHDDCVWQAPDMPPVCGGEMIFRSF